MIRSWGNSLSRRFYEQGKTSEFGGMDTDAAENLLAALDAAAAIPAYHLANGFLPYMEYNVNIIAAYCDNVMKIFQ